MGVKFMVYFYITFVDMYCHDIGPVVFRRSEHSV